MAAPAQERIPDYEAETEPLNGNTDDPPAVFVAVKYVIRS